MCASKDLILLIYYCYSESSDDEEDTESAGKSITLKTIYK